VDVVVTRVAGRRAAEGLHVVLVGAIAAAVRVDVGILARIAVDVRDRLEAAAVGAAVAAPVVAGDS